MKTNRVRTSARHDSMPPYIFSRLELLKAEYAARGMMIIDLGVGDPDFPTQQNIVDAMKRHLDNPETHRYPSFRGEPGLRRAVSEWYREHHSVEVDPELEVLVLLGSKEGIAHLPLAYLERGDYALVPDPGYPAYCSAVLLSEGIPYAMPLTHENDFLPVFDEIPREVMEKAKLMYLNYPNNPTSAIADESFFKRAVEFALEHNIIICHDFAYSELVFDELKATSFLSCPRALECGVEFHSFSKTYAMTGWRLGFVAGNRETIAALAKIKSCIDSGVFKAVQYAGMEGLTGPNERIMLMREEYAKRRDILVEGLGKIGFEFAVPHATYYFWIKVPDGFATSMEFTEFLLREKGIVVTPGIGFGQYGDAYFRISMNVAIPLIQEALWRLGRI